MDFVIITGMSGAGKTSALHVLEDIGCIAWQLWWTSGEPKTTK